MRLMIFETHPVQYHAPVYRELQRLCDETGCGSVRVAYASGHSLQTHRDAGFQQDISWGEPLLAGYASDILNTERGTPFTGFRSLGGRGVARHIAQHRPDAVMLTGLNYAFDWAAYAAALRYRIPVWIRTETQDRAFVRSWWKSPLRSMAYWCSYLPIRRAFAIGKLNAAHYTRHGVPASRLRYSRYCVVDRFDQSSAIRQQRRDEIRHLAGFTNTTKVLLFVGKFQPKKYPDLILDALTQMLPRERREYGVLFVGSGELESELRERARNFPEVKIHFAGFRNQEELPAYYHAADFFVLPSRQMGETWGLVVNEALLSGLRVMISEHVGCSADFSALPSVAVFDGTPGGLLRCLRKAAGPEATVGNRSFMEGYSVTRAAEAIAREMEAEGAHPKRALGGSASASAWDDRRPQMASPQ